MPKIEKEIQLEERLNEIKSILNEETWTKEGEKSREQLEEEKLNIEKELIKLAKKPAPLDLHSNETETSSSDKKERRRSSSSFSPSNVWKNVKVGWTELVGKEKSSSNSPKESENTNLGKTASDERDLNITKTEQKTVVLINKINNTKMPESQTIEELQSELEKERENLRIVSEKLLGRRASGDWESQQGHQEYKKNLENNITPNLEARIAELQTAKQETESEVVVERGDEKGVTDPTDLSDNHLTLDETGDDKRVELTSQEAKLDENRESSGEVVVGSSEKIGLSEMETNNGEENDKVLEVEGEKEEETSKLSDSTENGENEEERKQAEKDKIEELKNKINSAQELSDNGYIELKSPKNESFEINDEFFNDIIRKDITDVELIQDVRNAWLEKVSSLRENWLSLKIDELYDNALENGKFQYDETYWWVELVNEVSREKEWISIQEFINKNFAENSERFEKLEKKLKEKIQKLEDWEELEVKEEEVFTLSLQEKYEKLVKEENFSPEEKTWIWFGFKDDDKEDVLFQTSIGEIKNPERKTRLNNLFSETKESLRKLGNRYRAIKNSIEVLYSSMLTKCVNIDDINDIDGYWLILDVETRNYLPIDEVIDKEIPVNTKLNQRLKVLSQEKLEEVKKKWQESPLEIDEGESSISLKKTDVVSEEVTPYKLDSSEKREHIVPIPKNRPPFHDKSGSGVGGSPLSRRVDKTSGNPRNKNKQIPVGSDDSSKLGKKRRGSEIKTPPTPKENGGWGMKIFIGVVVVAGLAALAALVIRMIKNRRRGEKTEEIENII